MKPLNTINVVEYSSDSVQQVVSFPDTTEGNIAAETMFKSIATENGMDENDSDDCLADGLYEQGMYQVFIVHSTN
jgi:hypothetical protein